MSIVQFGENTVSIILGNKRYPVRELEIEDHILNTTRFDNLRLANVWKNQCLTKKFLGSELSAFREDSFFDEIKIEDCLIEIHFQLNQTNMGIFKDKRATAFAILQKS